ncbi:hypothetical protein [Shigella sonnei]|uniref:hypothetical protein n=1 Tax=Shigella sonnei TaxID=624 RepID=UPI003C79086B
MARTNQAASTSCCPIQARSAFLSRAAIRSPDSALLIWLRSPKPRQRVRRRLAGAPAAACRSRA